MNTSKDYKEVLEKHTKDQPEEIKAAMEQMTKKIYEDGASPKEAIGITDAMVESIYAYGYRLYNSGKYEQAMQLFRLLIMLDPSKTKYSMGLAASFHMIKDYNNAAMTYTLCSMIDKDNPLPHYHSADCYLQMGNIGLAAQSLMSCIELTKNKPEHAGVRERALVMLNSIKDALKPPDPKPETKPENNNKKQEKKK